MTDDPIYPKAQAPMTAAVLDAANDRAARWQARHSASEDRIAKALAVLDDLARFAPTYGERGSEPMIDMSRVEYQDSLSTVARILLGEPPAKKRPPRS